MTCTTKNNKIASSNTRDKHIHRRFSDENNRFYNREKVKMEKKFESKDRRRLSFGTIHFVDRSPRSLSFQEKGIVEHSESQSKKGFFKICRNNKSAENKASMRRSGFFSRLRICIYIIIALAVVGSLAYIAMKWVLENLSTRDNNYNNDGSDLNKEENFFAIDELSNFPSTSAYPTTDNPSSGPTRTITTEPSGFPTTIPSQSPSSDPSLKPSTSPSFNPSISVSPSKTLPSLEPSNFPSQSHTPTYIGWRQLGSDIISSDVVHSADISGDGNRIVIGMPIHANGGKIDIFQFVDDEWLNIREFSGDDVDWMYSFFGPPDSCSFLGIDVRLNRNGDRIGSISNTPSKFSNWTRIAHFVENSPGDWRAAFLHTDVNAFDLGSDSNYIDIADSNRGILRRYYRCGYPHQFVFCVSLGGYDYLLDIFDSGTVISSLSVSDSGNRIVVGRASYTLSSNGLPIIQGGRIDVYDIILSDKVYLERLKKDGDRSEDAFFGKSHLERKGDVVKISGDGSTVLIGGWIKLVYKDIFTSFNFTHPSYVPFIGKPYIDIFHFSDSEGWIQRGERITAPTIASAWGIASAINVNGNIIAIGDQVFNQVGMVRVYEYDGNSWIPMGQTFYGTTFERWGKSIAFSGDTIPKLIMSSTNGSNSTVRVFEYGPMK